jgi:molybdopterin/thiamine biosynthesis adenylyltransferase
VIDVTRIDGAVDPKLMANTHILGVGIGGAVGLYEDLARTNLGNLTAIDFDIVDQSNLTTQGFYQADINTLKTEALGKRLTEIGSNIQYQGLNQDFLLLSESEIESLVKTVDLLLFMTDNFHAQARGNRVALKYQKPAIFAMVYEKAACAEITFMIPGVTPGCHRCAVSPRYKAYQEGFENNVKQSRSTVFSTRYLNSCLGLLSLAILHNNTTGYEFSNWFGDYWERNLVQLRMNPAYGKGENSLFNRVFNHSPYILTFDSVWQKIEAESVPKYEENCPDCSGQGDLTKVSLIETLI